MQATVLTFSLLGLDPQPVHVEVDSGRGIAQFNLVGLPEASVRESRVRVRSALLQLGVQLDEYVITVNLAPADLRKSGGSFDLAIALGVLGALGRIPAERLRGVAVLGELSLSGAIQRVRGVLPILRNVYTLGVEEAVVPQGNAAEAARVMGAGARAAGHLSDVVRHFTGEQPLPFVEAPAARAPTSQLDVDLSELRGQHAVRRALEIAAAGAHNLLFIGPPGCGKTMAARRLPTILPPLSDDEALEVTAIHSTVGLVPASGILSERPFRAPHHTVSPVGLIGGGEPIRPGEVSLAHLGCLFLDEVAELRRGALEALRQPLEDGVVTVCRARGRATFPARPLFVAAANPCPCGFHGDPSRACVCSEERVRAYRARLSGPLLDRMDLQLAMRPVSIPDLVGGAPGESSTIVRARVCAARAVQTDRARRGEVRATHNSVLTAADLARVARLDAGCRDLLERAVDSLGLSARAYNKILRVARTIADLAGCGEVRNEHVAEAIQLRLLDRRVYAMRESAAA
ncbi:MAG: YifB family Mg chelatase-like AAA ATPase [Polyangiaceae bacterium]|nr:YifB family Mg chelatase-like AAA ATPase [Polyangiaceae bacterium]